MSTLRSLLLGGLELSASRTGTEDVAFLFDLAELEDERENMARLLGGWLSI